MKVTAKPIPASVTKPPAPKPARRKHAVAPGLYPRVSFEDYQDIEGVNQSALKDARTAERDRLAAELAKAKVESNTYHAAIMWALGVTGTWPARKPGDGAFYWRKRLQSMAGIGDDELSRSTAAKKPGRKGARR